MCITAFTAYLKAFQDAPCTYYISLAGFPVQVKAYFAFSLFLDIRSSLWFGATHEDHLLVLFHVHCTAARFLLP